VQDYYKQAEFYVLSSQYEGYPNVLIEAMSLGCPVIAVDCDFGPREIIKHGENGLLIPQGNSKLLSASIKELSNDEALRNRFATRGTAVARLNSVEAVVSTWDSLITGETQFKSELAETAS
jgi:glycosyltransferase involved in cell wall biosynthesis